MATTGKRAIILNFVGDTPASLTRNAVDNAASPATTDLVTLASGNNTITPPAGGSTPVAVTITPPSGNTQTLTLKGINADTGVVLHKTDPSSFGLNSPTNTFVITTSGIITGCRFDWS
jgi:hypothetical protein